MELDICSLGCRHGMKCTSEVVALKTLTRAAGGEDARSCLSNFAGTEMRRASYKYTVGVARESRLGIRG